VILRGGLERRCRPQQYGGRRWRSSVSTLSPCGRCSGLRAPHRYERCRSGSPPDPQAPSSLIRRTDGGRRPPAHPFQEPARSPRPGQICRSEVEIYPADRVLQVTDLDEEQTVSRSRVHDHALRMARLVRIARDVGVVEDALSPLRDLTCVKTVDRRVRGARRHVGAPIRRVAGGQLPQPAPAWAVHPGHGPYLLGSGDEHLDAL
jgi:hypothetical protein